MRRLWSVLTAAVLTAPLWTALPGASAASPAAGLPAVWPTPQRMTARPDGFAITRTVGLVRAADADGPALEAVRAALHRAGATDIRESSDRSGYADDGLARRRRARPARATRRGPHGPARRGLRSRRRAYPRRPRAGRARRGRRGGAFYAAQTPRPARRHGRRTCPAWRSATGRAMRYRGSIEGFYGTPWSHADRLDQLDYLGAHKMNTYEYAPKDDPYHRERWRDPYPADKLAELGELVDRARAEPRRLHLRPVAGAVDLLLVRGRPGRAAGQVRRRSTTLAAARSTCRWTTSTTAAGTATRTRRGSATGAAGAGKARRRTS